MNEYTPYTYLVGWSRLDLWYYGCEYARKKRVANPVNLMTSYFTSSKVVKRMIKLHGLPDVIEVRRIFTTAKEALNWENKVIRRILEGKSNMKWLNEGYFNGSVFVYKRTEAHKMKMSDIQRQRNYTHDETARRKMSDKAQMRSAETVKRQVKILREWSDTHGHPNQGRHWSPVSKDKMSKARSRKRWVYHQDTLIEKQIDVNEEPGAKWLRGRSPLTKHGGRLGEYGPERTKRRLETTQKRRTTLVP